MISGSRSTAGRCAASPITSETRNASKCRPSTLRRILKSKGITYQRTKTWKSSPDPHYEAKKDRILRLYRKAEKSRLRENEVVVCFDECGPQSLRPHAGSGWFKAKEPKRMRATFRRPHGISYLFGAYDFGVDRLFGDIRRRKDSTEVLRFLIKVRSRYASHIRIHLVLDNLSTHTTKVIRRWARRNNVALVFTPTYASHLNRIEAHFGALQRIRDQGLRLRQPR